VPPNAGRHQAVVAIALAIGCGGGAGAKGTVAPQLGGPPGLELHDTGGRPRLVVVRRDGDPAAGVAIEVRVDGDDGAVRAAALGALMGARLERSGMAGVEVVAAGRIARVRALLPALGSTIASLIDQALVAPVTKLESKALERALESVAARPVDDTALARASRCLDRPSRPASFKAPGADAIVATVEEWRVMAIAASSVVVGVVGSGGSVDAFATAWGALPALPKGMARKPSPQVSSGSAVALTMRASEGAVLVVEGLPRSAVPAALSVLADPSGALALRLRAADDFRARSVGGAARPEGGCIVVEVEPALAHAAGKDWSTDRVTMRAAVALEVARQEIDLAVESARVMDDAGAARTAIGSGGDPREAADRAAWWGWPQDAPSPSAAYSSTLLVPSFIVAKSPAADVEAATSAVQSKFDAALSRAKIAWVRAEIELRPRLELGQGEVWAALGTPCGVANEGPTDAGLARLALNALVSASAGRVITDGVSIEPWGSAVGVGVVAHAAARSGESPKALAHRVGDAAGRVFLASFPTVDSIAIARGEALAAAGGGTPPIELVRAGLRATLPEHPSWLDPVGTLDAIAKVGLESAELRLSTLRNAPLRLAVIANEQQDQVEAASRAAERWVPRRPGESRACALLDPGPIPKGAVRALSVHTGTGVALALPVEESQRESASTLAAVLAGPSGRLAVDFAPSGLATSFDVRLVRGIGRSALVLVVLAPDSNVDAVVIRLRALLEKLRNGGLAADDLARAEKERAAAISSRHLEPRARLVDLFTGELGPTSTVPDLGQLRAAATKLFDEDRTQLVVAHLGK
jgi:hypothetical protein